MPVRRHDRPPGLGHTAHGHQRWVGNHAAGQATETALEELAVEAVDGWDCTVVTLAGPLALCTVPQIESAVGKALINRGCVVVDLTNVQLKWEPGVAVFATSLEYAGGWPDARMVLFAADGELAAALERSQVARAVPLATDL